MSAVRVGLRTAALRPDERCGDAAAHHAWPGGELLAIIDGLGHGALAADAADAALRSLAAAPQQPLPELMARLDRDLAATRGAAVGLARIDGLRLQYAGVGNTRALRWRGAQWLRLSSQYGIVGGGLAHAIQVAEIDLQPGDWLLLFTDGLDEMLHLDVSLPEWQRDPVLLCDHLLAARHGVRDDGGVLARYQGLA